MAVPAAFLALVLAGCSRQEVVNARLTSTDIVFVNAIRANTRTVWGMGDTDLAGAGHQVCTVLAQGGTIESAIHLLLPARTIREKQDATYFATLAAQDFCPQYPTKKPAPKA